MTGGSRTQGVRNFLNGGGAGNYIVWVGDVGHLGVNGEEGRGGTHGVPATDNGEASEAIRRRYMGDAGGGRRTRGSGNPVGKDLHKRTAGNRGAVGGATFLILGMYKGDRLRRRWVQEGGVIAPRGNRETTLGHPDRLAGS